MQHSENDYPRTSRDKVRYADTDRQGHVNNAVFSTFLETARVELFYDSPEPLADPDAEFVIAHLSLDFLGEIQWPGLVTVATGVQKIGTSSVTLAQAIFQDDRCVARAEAVTVHIDTATRKARPLNERARSVLEALRLSKA